MNFSEIVQQNLQAQLQQQQIQQEQERVLREQQQIQQLEQQLHREQQNGPARPAEEYWQIFDQSVNRIFKEWTALQLALVNEWGGRSSGERALEMKEDILDLFLTGKPVYSDQIEKILDECLSQDLNTVAEDGSYKQVAEMIIQCYNLAARGLYNELVNFLGPETSSVIGNCVKGAGNDSDDEVSEMGDDSMMEDDDDMEDGNDDMEEKEKNKKFSEPDEDGWVTVNPKRK
ncbi:hypothetical protein DICPUDRAFT_148317 [Dictyostelium purpureum]|uniref:Pre-rRNA-processing protein TSR2 homolog n=1 Tax=Dictyostelium purpureum TaxID=5786 RepID=F0ZAT3_DICPU|nr:uncharacterized protein DICPUDRAFT_148317 [Dictyostelium purpureum]EGC38975.1 hypothetical protein DICPUDRAFT_148317 [Dictyostelium purpureum]|eukprot:XP_003284540.1 hypothetical protein DICPUDRAFT_148317 [Dictyostelium purpureum]